MFVFQKHTIKITFSHPKTQKRIWENPPNANVYSIYMFISLILQLVLKTQHYHIFKQ